MNQQYCAYVVDENLSLEFRPDLSGMGGKLAEHAFVTSRFVNAILFRILNNPRRIAWVGEFSYDDTTEPYTSNENVRHPYPMTLEVDDLKDCFGMYLVNHSRKEYVDMKHYIEQNTRIRMWKGKKLDVVHMTSICLSPLVLLTAYVCHEYDGADAELVGRWAFDEIELILEPVMGGYTEITPSFVPDGLLPTNYTK